MPSSFVEIDIRTNPSVFEEIVGILSQSGFLGFWEDEGTLKCYIPENLWSNGLLLEIQNRINDLARARELPPPPIATSTLQDQNWNKAWEATVKPIKVTDRIVITPTWEHYTPSGTDIVILIDPKMSFGTGYHETTRLTLKLIEHHLPKGGALLDFGTGTGVLAIAAAKLGARVAVGVDNDEWSYNNALENIGLNKVDRQVSIILGELAMVTQGPFDVIAANIQKNVILSNLSRLTEQLLPDGVLILSGLLLDDRDGIRASLAAAGFAVVEELTEHEWLAFAAKQSESDGQPS